MSKHEVRQTVVLSTAHIRASTMEAFEAQRADCGLPLICCFAYGFYLWVPPTDQLKEYTNSSPDVRRLLKWARKNGYDEIKLDRDAGEVEGLPTWRW